MNLFKSEFPNGSVVSVTMSEDRVVVSVNSPRPNPVWLHNGTKTGRLGNSKLTESELDCEMFKIISTEPGRAKSYYTQLSKDSGGFGCSQQRKEKSVDRLISSGLVVVKPLDNPVGRKTHEIWPV